MQGTRVPSPCSGKFHVSWGVAIIKYIFFLKVSVLFLNKAKKTPAESCGLTSASALLTLLFSAGFILNQVFFLSLIAALDSHS